MDAQLVLETNRLKRLLVRPGPKCKQKHTVRSACSLTEADLEAFDLLEDDGLLYDDTDLSVQ